jgi:hypothetical protein
VYAYVLGGTDVGVGRKLVLEDGVDVCVLV